MHDTGAMCLIVVGAGAIVVGLLTAGKQQTIILNYNRASDVCVWVCKSTPRTADVTVTKIAGYVRVPILMNR